MNKQFLKNNGFSFIVILIFSIVISSVVASFLYNIPGYKKIEIFISSAYIDTDFFESKISNVDGVEKVNVISRSPSSNYFDDNFVTIGLYSDIIIMSDEYLENENAYSSFSPISFDYFTKYNLNPSDFELITSNGICYGIVVYDIDQNINLFKDKVVFENSKRYIICVGKTTPNVYNNPKKENETSNAFLSLMELIAK